MGWASSIFYHLSHTPQLLHNYRCQTVGEIALATFTIIYVANRTYVASLITPIPVAESVIIVQICFVWL